LLGSSLVWSHPSRHLTRPPPQAQPPPGWVCGALSRACRLAAEGRLPAGSRDHAALAAAGAALRGRGVLGPRGERLLALALGPAQAGDSEQPRAQAGDE
jgi:alkanesulfonate monooxygenase SsuD/methylene tetrahydromethanopterin reductase-like flavin-dependent oxidoreductase (luciferase family)